MSSHISCENPVLILNPSLTGIILQSVGWFLDGQPHQITEHQKKSILSGDSPSKVFNLPYVHPIEKKDNWTDKEYQQAKDRLQGFLDGSFFVNEDGESFDIWTYVPCGHCDVCLSKKLTSYLQRCQFAYEESKLPAYFVTLTYNKEYIPDDGVVKEDVQKFIKRLRRLCSARYPDVKVSYLCTSEYGCRNGRPHYHLILYGLPYVHENESRRVYLINKMIQYCWRKPVRDVCKGTFMTFDKYLRIYPKAFNLPRDYDLYSYGFSNVSLVSGSAAVNYILKYCFKDSFPAKPVHDGVGKNATFKLCSNNMGMRFVEPFRQYILHSVDGKFTYKPIDDLKSKSVSLCSYYLKKLFPSESQLIPSDFRKSYFSTMFLADTVINDSLSTPSLKSGALCCKLYLQQHYPFMPFLANDCEVKFQSYNCETQFDNLLENSKALATHFQNCISYEIDYEAIQKKVAERSIYFDKFRDRSDGQLRDVAVKFRRDTIINQLKSTL